MNRRAGLVLPMVAIVLVLSASPAVAVDAPSVSIIRKSALGLMEKSVKAYGKRLYPEAEKSADGALKLARAIEDLDLTATALVNRAAALRKLGRNEDAGLALDELLSATHVTYPPARLAEASALSAILALDRGDGVRAAALAEPAISLCKKAGCARMSAYMNIKARGLLAGKDYRGAMEEAGRAAAESRSAKDQGEEANALRTEAMCHAGLDEHAQALALYGRALDMDKRLGRPGLIVMDLEGIAGASSALGDADASRNYYLRALSAAMSASDESAVARITAAMKNLSPEVPPAPR